MAELRLEALLEAEAVGRVGGGDLPPLPDLARDVLPVSAALSRGGHRTVEDRSRRPKVSPGQIDAEVEAEICRMRREHPRWGARRIHGELRGAGWVPPAVSKIHQVLRRNHLIADQPPRRPRRFNDQHRTGQRLVKTTRSARGIADRRRSDRFSSVVE
jgi:hypothetical protein